MMVTPVVGGEQPTMREIYEKYGHKYDVTLPKLDGSNSIQDALMENGLAIYIEK